MKEGWRYRRGRGGGEVTKEEGERDEEGTTVGRGRQERGGGIEGRREKDRGIEGKW